MLNLSKTKEFYETQKPKLKKLNLIFSIFSILMMLAYPIFAIITKMGNFYINISVLIVSSVYGIFWLILGNKKAYKINRIYKWSRILLSLVSLSINIYSIYMSTTNVNIWAILMSIFMGIFWILNVIFNVLYEIISRKLHLIIEETKSDLNNAKAKIAEIKEIYTSLKQEKQEISNKNIIEK